MHTRETILIVEDERFNASLLQDMLQPKYETETVFDGEHALQLLDQGCVPDLILLDVMMPGIDGYEICKRIKANPLTKDFPVIFMTSKSEPADIARGFEVGAIDYVTKPVNYIVLQNRIRVHIELQRSIKESENALLDIDTLRGFLPVCCSCKKVRTENGNWEELEGYVESKLDVSFENSLCPNCRDHSETVNPVEDFVCKTERNMMLLVEDERFNLNMLVDILKDDYELRVAKDGMSALQRCQDERKPDLILLDVLMPGIDGFETCKQLKANPETSDIPVIFMTVKRESADLLKGFEVGGVDYIIKPIDYKELKIRVNSHMNLQNQRKILENQVKEIKTLSGLLPYCPKCKSVRNDKGYWELIDAYVGSHSAASISHGLCDDCMKKLYPDLTD
jgi:PleD family two-component response regulator